MNSNSSSNRTLKPMEAEDGFAFWDELAHDLRGPFNGVLGFAEILGNEVQGPLNDGQKEYIRLITESATELYQLVNAALTLSRLRVRKQTAERERLDLSGLLERAVEKIQTEFFCDSETITVNGRTADPLMVAGCGEETEKSLAFLLTAASISAGDEGVAASVGSDSAMGYINLHWAPPETQGADDKAEESLSRIIAKPRAIRERIVSLSINAGVFLIGRQGGRVELAATDAGECSLTVQIPLSSGDD